MNEPFDVEISRALKKSAGETLHDLEFTKEMQQKVLARIRAEESGETAPQERPSKRSGPAPFLKPVAWTAVAAAAIVLAFKMDMTGLLGANPKTSSPSAAESTASAPDGAAATTAANNQRPTAPPAPKVEEKAGSAAPTIAAQSVASAAGGQPEAITSNAATIRTFDVMTAPVTTLTPPREEAAPGDAARGMPAPAPAGFAKALVAEEKVSIAYGGVKTPIVELSSQGVRATDHAGAQLWMQPLDGVTDGSRLVVSADGNIAASAENKVYLLNQSGEVKSTLDAGAKVAALAWSADGRLAVCTDNAVTVYKNGAATLTVDGLATPEIAFGPDGSLAVSDPSGLRLFSMDGNRLFKVARSWQGQGLSFLMNGKVILAGNQAFDRTGSTLWHAPLAPEGTVIPDREMLAVVWDGHLVLGLRPSDGAELWRAVLPGEGDGLRGVSVSTDGKQIVLQGSAERGAFLWVLGSDGKLVRSKRWPEVPLSASIDGEHWVVLTPQALVVEPVQ